MFIVPEAVAPFRLRCEHPIYCKITDAWLGVDRHTEPETYANPIAAALEAHVRNENSDDHWDVVDSNGKPAFATVSIAPSSDSAAQSDEIPF